LINSLRGTVTEKGSNYLCLEIQGVEWQLDASATTIAAAPAVGSEGKLFTWLYHKEDQMSLFGFSTRNERFLFLDLISVSGVGPKGALKILSSARADQFVQYLEDENLTALSSLPGLGKKTAQKIILQLRGKLTRDEDSAPGGGSASGPEAEWVESLSAMGFEKRRVQSVVRTLLKDEALQGLSADKKEQELLRRAIVELSS